MTKRKKLLLLSLIIICFHLIYILFNLFKRLNSVGLNHNSDWREIYYLLIILVEIIGIATFIFTNFAKSNILKIYLSFKIIMFPISLLQLKTISDSYTNSNNILEWSVTFQYLITIVVYVFNCILLWILSNIQKPRSEFVKEENSVIVEFTPASTFARLVHRVVDVLVIIMLLYMQYKDFYFRDALGLTFLKNETLYSIIFISFLYYYFLLEGVFNITIAKCLTSSMVVNEECKRPNFGQMAIRTLCRFIPFDSFSFLKPNPRGWHDSISKTYVIKYENRNDLL